MKGKRVLIIEDSRFIGQLVQDELEDRGFEVLKTTTAREGLALIKTENPSLVILDLILPDFSGESVCKAIKQDDASKEIPIIMMTAKGSDADKVVGRVIGADAYIAKPFDVEELVREVRRLTG